MVQVLTPRESMQSEVSKLQNILMKNLTDEEKVILLKHHLDKLDKLLHDPMYYKQAGF